MKSYLVSYDLHNATEERYAALIHLIRELDKGALQALESVWIVDTPLTPNQVYEKLSPAVQIHADTEDTDKILITEITRYRNYSAGYSHYKELLKLQTTLGESLI